MFRGVSEINLDDKGRLAIPARYRPELQQCCANQMVLTVGLDRCLLLYPLPEFEDIERKLVRLPSLNPKVKRLQRLLMGHASECELDGQGRCLIPETLRRFAGLGKRVALVGQGAKFELWDAETWNQARDEWIEVERNDAEALSPELETLSF